MQAGANSDIAGSVTSTPAGITCSWAPSVPCTDTGAFVNGTTVTLTVATAGMTVAWGGACLGATGAVCNLTITADTLVTIDTRILLPEKRAEIGALPLALSSQLEVAEGEGQVVTNGRIAFAAAAGDHGDGGRWPHRGQPSRSSARPRRRTARNLAVRLQRPASPASRPGSLRVIAGTVAIITGNAVIFRLQGKPGERVVFTFEIDP